MTVKETVRYSSRFETRYQRKGKIFSKTRLFGLLTLLALVFLLIIFLKYNNPKRSITADWNDRYQFEYISQVVQEPGVASLARYNYYQGIILVNTAPENTLHRTAVRLTWSRQRGEHNVRIFFVCIVTDSTSADRTAADSDLDDLLLEGEQGQDLVILRRPSLTISRRDSSDSLAALEWAHRKFPQYDAVLMTDDHTIVNIDNLMPQLEEREGSVREVFGIGRDSGMHKSESRLQRSEVRDGRHVQ